MFDGGKHIETIGVEMFLQGELVTTHEVTAVAPALNRQSGQGFFLYADVRCTPVILKDLLQIAGAVAAARLNAVKALRIFARIIVDLELLVAANFQLVAHPSHLNTVQDISLSL